MAEATETEETVEVYGFEIISESGFHLHCKLDPHRTRHINAIAESQGVDPQAVLAELSSNVQALIDNLCVQVAYSQARGLVSELLGVPGSLLEGLLESRGTGLVVAEPFNPFDDNPGLLDFGPIPTEEEDVDSLDPDTSSDADGQAPADDERRQPYVVLTVDGQNAG